MTCIRLLEILPVVFGRLCPLLLKRYEDSGKTVENLFDYKWLHDLMDWGKSQLKVVVVYWKKTVTSLLHLLKESCSSTSLLTVNAVENLISSGELKTFMILSWRISLSYRSFIYFLFLTFLLLLSFVVMP